MDLRNELEHELVLLLVEHEMDHLDIAQVRSRDRIITQAMSRALFEDRAELHGDGEPLELSPDLEPLRQVCDNFGLRMVAG